MANIVINILLYLPLMHSDMNLKTDTACFYLNEYANYCGSLHEFQDTGTTIELTLEFQPEIWESIDLLMMFNLQWNKRNQGEISGGKPVQIVMHLDKDLYTKLKASEKLITDRGAFVVSDPSHPMRGTSNWFATEVTEEADLPEDMKSMGTVRQGFTTHWKRGN